MREFDTEFFNFPNLSHLKSDSSLSWSIPKFYIATLGYITKDVSEIKEYT
jgi:hypothetical protein